VHFRVWWVSPDSNRDAPKERSALQAGAANRIRLTPKMKTLAESLGIEPSRARALGTLAMCWLTICLALRGTGMRIRTPCAWFGIKLLSQEHPDVNMAEGRRFELLCPCGAAVFGTAGLPIAHTLRVLIAGGRGETRTLKPEGSRFLRPVCIPIPPLAHGALSQTRTG
jgi:hypothetical protein